MKKQTKIFYLFLIMLSFTACQSSVEPTGSLATKTEKVGVGAIPVNPEEIKGRIDVYTSIARASKYNINDMVVNMEKNIENVFKSQPPVDELIFSIKSSGKKGKHQIYDSLRIVDFALLFANSEIVRDREYVRKNYLVKSGQDLTINAIRQHKNVMFAHKKIKEITKLVDAEKKKISLLNEKFDKQGMLNSDDLELRKGLEVAVYKLNMLKDELALEVANYSRLIKASEKDKISLEGRAFYEERFDSELTVDLFQKIAVKNRREFVAFLALNKDKKYDYSYVESVAIKKYPEVERMVINGYSAKDEKYVKSLEKRSTRISKDLIENTYNFSGSFSDTDFVSIDDVVDNISVAIFTQIELAFNVIKINDILIAEYVDDLKKMNDELKAIGKQKNSNSKDVDFLNKKIDIFKLEYQISDLIADQHAAIRALYFYSGFDMFDEDFLDDTISGISKKTKVLFNQKNIETLSGIDKVSSATNKMIMESKDNNWAREDKWIEKLVDKNPTKDYGSLPPPPAQKKYNEYLKTLESSNSIYSEFYNDSHRSRKVMQLGAYSNVENANNNWSNIYNLYPEARVLVPEIETITINGKEIHRLIVRSETADLVKLCNMIRSDGMQCILK